MLIVYTLYNTFIFIGKCFIIDILVFKHFIIILNMKYLSMTTIVELKLLCVQTYVRYFHF